MYNSSWEPLDYDEFERYFLHQPPQSTLDIAAHNGHDDIIKFLLDNNDDSDVRPQIDGTVALCGAAFRGYESTVRLLLKRGADSTLRFSASPLFAVIMTPEIKGQEDIVRVLLEYSENVLKHQPTKHLFYGAIRAGDPAVVRLLVEVGGYTIDNTLEIGGFPILHGCLRGRDSPMVEMLLDMGADIDVRNNSGLTPMIVAHQLGLDEVASTFLKRGANIFFKPPPSDDYPATTLSWADGSVCPLFMEILLEKLLHIDNESWNNIDETKFFLEAVASNYEPLARLLLGRGVNVNIRNKFGKTALHIACGLDNYRGEDMVALLLDAGANVQLEDSDQETPIDIAVRFRRKSAASLLRAKMPYTIARWVIRLAPN